MATCLEHTGKSLCVADRLLKQKDFFIVANEIGGQWMEMANRLLKNADVETICIDNYVHGTRIQAFRTLIKWQQQNPELATARKLAKILLDIGRKDIANRIFPEPPVEETDQIRSPLLPEHPRQQLPQSEALILMNFVDTKVIVTESNGSRLEKRYCSPVEPRNITINVNDSLLTTSSRPAQVESKGSALKKQNSVPTQPYNISNNTGEDPLVANARSEEDTFLQGLQERLKKTYRQISLPGISGDKTFVANGYTNRTLVTKYNREMRVEKLENIFVFKNGNENPTRILVTGIPGYGKTALVNKLAFDWANSKEYIKHFEVLFVVDVRKVQGSFEDILLNSAEIKSTKKNKEYLKIIEQSSKGVLLLLDGVDESIEDKIWFKSANTFTNMTIVFTALPGLQMNSFVGKSVVLKGLSEKEQDEFLKNCTWKWQDVKKQLKHLHTPDKLTESPLFLLWFVSIAKEKRITTKTELYKQVFTQLYIGKHFNKEGNIGNAAGTKQDDLFEFSKSHHQSEMQLLLTKYSQFALTHISREEIRINSGDEGILKLGFMEPTDILDTYESPIIMYKPTDKQIMDFLAACYLRSLLNSNPVIWEKTVSSYRPKLHKKPSLVFSFLVGLLQNQADRAFHALKCYSSEYTHSFGPLCSCLTETKMNDDLLSVLTDFLPLEWKIRWLPDDHGFSSSIQHGQILSHGIKTNKIMHITWELSHPACLPKEKKVNILQINLENSPYESVGDLLLECTELRCFLNAQKPSDVDEEIVMNLFLISFDYISFYLNEFSCNVWLHCIKDFVNTEILNVHSLTCVFDGNQVELVSALACILATNSVAEVDITLSTNEKYFCENRETSLQTHFQVAFEELVKQAGKSVKLRRFRLRDLRLNLGNPMTVDFMQLCDSGKKSWEQLQLEHVVIDCRGNAASYSAITYLNIVSAEVNTAARNYLECCNVTTVVCKISFIEVDCKLWCNDKITELCVESEQVMLVYLGMSKLFRGLKNLKVFSLALTSSSYHPFNFDAWFFGNANDVKLKGFEIWFAEQNPRLCLELVKGIVASLRKRQSLISNQLELGYLTLQTEMTLATNSSFTSKQKKHVKDLQLMVGHLKEVMMEKYLCQLFIIGYSDILENISWEHTVSENEGFVIQNETLGRSNHTGMKQRNVFDSRHNRWPYDQRYGFYRRTALTYECSFVWKIWLWLLRFNHRFCIQHGPETCGCSGPT